MFRTPNPLEHINRGIRVSPRSAESSPAVARPSPAHGEFSMVSMRWGTKMYMNMMRLKEEDETAWPAIFPAGQAPGKAEEPNTPREDAPKRMCEKFRTLPTARSCLRVLGDGYQNGNTNDITPVAENDEAHGKPWASSQRDL